MRTIRRTPGERDSRREILQLIYGKPPGELPDEMKALVARLEEVEKPREAEGHVSRIIRRAVEKFNRS
jgi:hypothetical protein